MQESESPTEVAFAQENEYAGPRYTPYLSVKLTLSGNCHMLRISKGKNRPESLYGHV